MAKKQERLLVNRIEELRCGINVNIKQKNKVLRIRDKWINHYIKMYKSGRLSLSEYWKKIVDLKKDFNIEERIG